MATLDPVVSMVIAVSGSPCLQVRSAALKIDCILIISLFFAFGSKKYICVMM
jgi:hypothetical protein